MNHVPDAEPVKIPGGTLLTVSPEQGRELAFAIARRTVQNIQADLGVLVAGRTTYAVTPNSPIADSQVVAIGFQTIAAAKRVLAPVVT